jgi:thymidine kinase
MVKVLYGKKGSGKTKSLIDSANSLASECKGYVVFIDYSNKLMYDLKHEVRFINVSEFPVMLPDAFLGFVCGIVSANYDVDGIFIDGLTYIVKEDINQLKEFLDVVNRLSGQYNVKFYISINGDIATVPDFIKEYL